MNTAAFNRHLETGRVRAEEHLAELERGYRLTLRAAGRHAADRFSALATDHLTAAVDPKWSPPEESQLLDGETMQQDARKRTLAARKNALKAVMAPALAEVGVGFDLTNPLIAGLVDGLGARTADLGDAISAQIAQAVADSYQQGLSIPNTAAAIRAAVDGISDVRATMLARTEMISLVNGGSIAAARLVNGASDAGEPQVGYKRWLATEDERTRETHAEADGQVVAIDQPFQVGGEQADYPGDAGLSDEEACNCRCTVTYLEAAEAVGETEDMAIAAASAPEVSNLAMVAVYPRFEEAQTLATPGGQDAGSLHVTLLFLGEADALDAPRAHQVAGSVAQSLPPLDGTVGGVASFGETPDGYPAIILPDVQGLSTLQEAVRAALADAGIESPSEHGFLPHMTLDYADTATPPDEDAIGAPLHFDALSVVVGGKRTDYQLAASTESPTDAVASGGHMAESPQDTLTADVTVTVGDSTATEQAEDTGQVRWQAVLCVEEEPTEDGRMLEAGSITWRELPLSLGVMFETPHSFEASAEIGGRIDRIWRDGNLIRGEGVFTQDDVGRRAAQMVADLTLRGISVDLGVLAYELRDANPPVATDDTDDTPDQGDDIADVITEIDNLLFVVTEGVIGAATVCPYQAIAGATISVVAAAAGEGGPDRATLNRETCFVLTHPAQPVGRTPDDALTVLAAATEADRAASVERTLGDYTTLTAAVDNLVATVESLEQRSAQRETFNAALVETLRGMAVPLHHLEPLTEALTASSARDETLAQLAGNVGLMVETVSSLALRVEQQDSTIEALAASAREEGQAARDAYAAMNEMVAEKFAAINDDSGPFEVRYDEAGRIVGVG